jgi:glycosyltransferase involved in cell wall biosynthesis
MSKIDISIIIATRNREEILWETVQKACAVVENINAEILVINDGDSILNVPNALAHKIRCFNNTLKGVSSARNLGAAKANGSILFFIDDDMWIKPEAIDWIYCNLFNKDYTEVAYFINWEYPPYLKEMLSATKIGRYLLSTNYHTLWGRLHKDFPPPVSGLYKYDSVGSGSLVMQKNVFNKTGGYNNKIVFQGEDADLANKLNRLRIPIYIVFDITLYHNHRDRLEITNFLKRSYDGFGSEFKAVTSGEVATLSGTTYKGLRRIVLEFSRITEKGWIYFLNILPNHPVITPLNNKLIGALGGLQKYKQWRNVTVCP